MIGFAQHLVLRTTDDYLNFSDFATVMTYLGPEELNDLLDKGLVYPHPRSGNPVPGWDLDLKLGSQVFVNSSEEIQPLAEDGSMTIQPGEFALLLTEEDLSLPDNIVGFISLKFSFKQRGLINVSGFHVDPGYKGKLLFSVFNAGPRPILLSRGDPIFMIVFSRLTSDAPRSKDAKSFQSIPSSVASEVMDRPVSVFQIDQRLREVENVYNKRKEAMKQIGLILFSALVGGLVVVGLQLLFGVL